ncbi:MAG: biotin/lipoyl-binding protein [Hyphomonadaceae bacterium]|nr:biotin/lipoyl-binding protein [Hyphomonadaceae bacterium]
MTKTTETGKILIANRGEIACRVIRTARKMGMDTVAVYSDADTRALHVKMADEAVRIGPGPAIESYLVIDNIVAACKATGADAVHPGYGFLSENPDFARRLKAEGISFIGPDAGPMEAMGLKDAARERMTRAGVPVTPGYHGRDQDPDLLQSKAAMIGYPVLIKAVAGGGGKGMRRVDKGDAFPDALAACQREARSSFGEDRVLIEKYITDPRHIEVQIFGDSHGNIIHLFERDCSLQRRHQKVIEEAPAPNMTEEVRQAMTDAAIKAAKAVNYTGAGTVEFIVDGSGTLRTDGFWFMEMNTRLQVEHPVTEMVTGLDLVELQIHIAGGGLLPRQEDIKMSGHAVEARLYAEDPAKDFLPGTGRILHINAAGRNHRQRGYRIDAGYGAPSDVTIHYDPMIAKIIGYGQDRAEAVRQTRDGLRGICVHPLKTNTYALLACLDHEAFRNEDISTDFLSRHADDLLPCDIHGDNRAYGILTLRILDTLARCHDGWRLNLPARSTFRFKRGDGVCEVRVLRRHADFAKFDIDGDAVTFNFDDPLPDGAPDESIEGQLDHPYAWNFLDCQGYFILEYRGAMFLFEYADETGHMMFSAGDAISAPMPGRIIAVNVSEGDAVRAGDRLIVMEAMKMETALQAPRDGVVEKINFAPGDPVNDGDILITLQA